MNYKFLIAFVPLFIISVIVATNVAHAQKAYTKNGKINFSSKAPMEKIEAVNKSVTSILDLKTGEVQFSVLMQGFEFEKALMQEHFNEDYVESDKYPKATFKGKVEKNEDISYANDGTYDIKVKGELTLHGVVKQIETPGQITISGGVPELLTAFNILLWDYKISIPTLVTGKISETIKVTVAARLDNTLK